MGEPRPEWASLVHAGHDIEPSALTWLTSGLGTSGLGTGRQGTDGSVRRPIVLDVGCGPGLPLDRMLVDSGIDVVAVDSSPVAVDTARGAIPEAIHIERDLYDLDGLHPAGNRFDAAVSLFAMAALSREDIDRTLNEIHHVLAPGAPFLLAMPAPSESDRGGDRGDGGEEADGEQTREYMGEAVPQTAFERGELQLMLERNGFTVLQLRPARQPDGHTDLYARCVTR